MTESNSITGAPVTLAAREALDALPDYMCSSIVEYIERGLPQGDFLRCVIENDLRGCAAHADDTNKHFLREYAVWMLNHAPAICWGSAENYDNWLKYCARNRGEA